MKILLLPFLVLFSILVGCNVDDKNRELMDKADSLLDLHPDSSLTLLNKINREKLQDTKEKARYGLLYTMSKLKTGSDIKGDSCFTYAENYYKNINTPSREKMLTHFAKAALSDSMIEKLNEFDKTIEYASGKGSYTYKALAYFNKAHTYHEAYSYPDEIESANLGLELILTTNDTSNIIYGYLAVGMANNANGDRKEAINNFTKALNLIKCSTHKNLSDVILKEMAYTNSALGNHQKAVEIYDSLATLKDITFSASDVCMYALSLANQSQFNTAESLLKSLDNECLHSNRIEWFYTNAILMYNKKDYKSAYEYLDSIFAYDNMLIKAKLDANLPREEKIKAIGEVKLQKEITNKNKQIALLATILCAVLLFVFVMTIIMLKSYSRNRFESQQKKFNQLKLESENEKNFLLKSIEKLDSENRVAKDNLSAMQEQIYLFKVQKNNLTQLIFELKNKINKMDNDNGRLLNEVNFYQKSKVELSRQISAQEITIRQINDSARKLFYSIHKNIASFCNNLPQAISTIEAIKMYEIQRNLRLDIYKDNSLLSEIESQINEFMEDVLSMLKQTLILTDADVKTLIYDICGFNYRSIAYLLNVAPSAAGARRTRLKDKIKKIDEEKLIICEKYINLL